MSKDNPKYGGLGESLLDDFLMVLLALVSVALLFFEALVPHTQEQSNILEVADVCICVIFLGEWIIRLINAPQKKVFFKKHWWELLASAPLTSAMFQGFQGINALRLIRVIRLIRIIRLVVRIKILLSLADKYFKDPTLVYACFLVGTVMTASTLGFQYMEYGHNENIKTLWDSFWWVCVTICTVGYGDIYPVTDGGRIIAIFLMTAGTIAVPLLTGLVIAKVIAKNNKDDCNDAK